MKALRIISIFLLVAGAVLIYGAMTSTNIPGFGRVVLGIWGAAGFAGGGILHLLFFKKAPCMN